MKMRHNHSSLPRDDTWNQFLTLKEKKKTNKPPLHHSFFFSVRLAPYFPIDWETLEYMNFMKVYSDVKLHDFQGILKNNGEARYDIN